MDTPPFPECSRVELPLLQELRATGGSDQVRFLSERLVRYFPQLQPRDLSLPASPGRKRWLRLLQRTAQRLCERGELRRGGQRLELTERGLRRAEAEALQPEPSSAAEATGASHVEIQRRLCDIGRLLGKHAQVEFEEYDVVYRDRERAPRLSHVFEVQVHGSVDGALARLKRAHEAQRSRLYLVVADERSERFAARRLQLAFPELADLITVIGTGEIDRLHRDLTAHGGLLRSLL